MKTKSKQDDTYRSKTVGWFPTKVPTEGKHWIKDIRDKLKLNPIFAKVKKSYEEKDLKMLRIRKEGVVLKNITI